MRIALAQISSTRDVAHNIEILRENVAKAAKYDANLVVFPEASMLSFEGPLPEETAAHQDEWEKAVKDVAQQHNIAVAAGGFKTAGERVYNQLLLAYPDGSEKIYNKMHLFDAYGFEESENVAAGDELVLAEVAGVQLGLTVCYDVRFPKLYAEYSRAGAQVMLVIASWGEGSGKVEQWRALTTARALDSNSYVVAVGQAHPLTVGADPDESPAPLGIGRSRVIDPFGRELVELGQSPDLRLVELDLDLVEEAHQKLPVLENAKLGY